MRRDAQRRLASAGWVLASWAPMLWWYAALRPGLMSADSLESWRQATRGGWIDLQPPLYTAAMWVSNAVLGSPSLLTLGQSLFLATSVVSVARAVRAFEINSRLVIGVSAVVAASPMVGAFSVSLWKDIPFTAALLFAVARLLDATRTNERQMVLRAAGWLALGTALRQNGILVAAPALLATATIREWRRTAAAGLAACVAVIGLAKVVVYPALGVAEGPANSTVSTFLHDIASVAARDPAALDPADRRLLERVAPIDTWTGVWSRFGCSSANWQFDPAFDWRLLDGYQRDSFRLWVELLLESPRAVVRNRACVGAVAWRPDAVGELYTVSRGIDPNDMGLETAPVVDSWRRHAVTTIARLDNPDVQRFVWRAPMWLYLCYAVVGVTAWRRRRPLLLLPLAVPASVQLAVVVLNPAQDARYLMPALMSAWLLLPMAAVPDTNAASPDQCKDRVEENVTS